MEIEQIIMKLQETMDRSERNEGRIKKLEGESAALHKLATSSAVMAEQLKTMNESLSKLTAKVETLEGKPVKRFEWISNKVLWAIIGAVVAFLLHKIGL